MALDLNELLPSFVVNTDGKTTSFDPNKIIDSLMYETNLSQLNAYKVMLESMRKISGMTIKTITAPHIREIVCCTLSEMGFNKERNLYTRIGIPFYDLKKLLSTSPICAETIVLEEIKREYRELLR